LEEEMKKAIVFASILVAAGPFAYAKNVTLTGAAAASFIERHFPDAAIPGQVKGAFQYADKQGNIRRGYAECFVPAMGAHSEGAVSRCDVIYNSSER
jgi:hypothetical protein